MGRIISWTCAAIVLVAIFYIAGALGYHTARPKEMLRYVAGQDWSTEYRPLVVRMYGDYARDVEKYGGQVAVGSIDVEVAVTNCVSRTLIIDSVRVFRISTRKALPIYISGWNYDFPSDVMLATSVGGGYWIMKEASVRIMMRYPSGWLGSKDDIIPYGIFENKDIALGVYTNRGEKTIPIKRYFVNGGSKEVRD